MIYNRNLYLIFT